MLIARLDPALAQHGTGAVHAAMQAHARRPRESGGDDQVRSIALGTYLVVRLARLTLGADGPDGDAEGLDWQRTSTARYVDDLPTVHPECAHLRLIVAAMSEGARSDLLALRRALLGYAAWLEREGRLDLSLELLAVARCTWLADIPPADFCTLALTVGRVNRQLARLPLAADAYAAAEEGAFLAADHLLALRARLGSAAIRRLRGHHHGLEEELHIILAESEQRPELGVLLPLVHADLGSLYAAQGRMSDAVRAMVRAVRAASQPPERMRMLAGLGQVLLELGAGDVAHTALSHVARQAEDRLTQAGAQVELMDLASVEGDRLAFERLRAGLREYIWRLPAAVRVDFLYRSGVGFSRFSQYGRAAKCWSEAMDLAEAQQLEEWVRTIARLECSIRDCQRVYVEPTQPWLDGYENLEHDVLRLLVTGT